MKTLQTQYNLIKEGKGDKAYFMKLARYNFPDLVTPVLSYNDTITVLKNKSILSEGIGGIVTTGKKQDWHAIFNENMEKLKEDDATKKENIKKAFEYYNQNQGRISMKDAAAKFGVEEFEVMMSLTPLGANNPLREAKEAKAEEKETTKEVTDMATRGYDYKDTKNYDNVFGEEFLKGYYTEMKDPKNEGKHVEELRQIVAKNLAKDISHYVKNGQFGTKGVGYTVDAPGLGESKPAKGPHKSSGYGDLKESVLRSQIHLLVKEVLAEENKDLPKYRLGVLKAALADAEKEIKKVDKDGKPLLDKDSKAFKDWKKTIAAKKREIEALEKEVLDEVKQPELKAALDAADKAYDENKYNNVDDFLKTYKGKYKNEVENALKSKYEG